MNTRHGALAVICLFLIALLTLPEPLRRPPHAAGWISNRAALRPRALHLLRLRLRGLSPAPPGPASRASRWRSMAPSTIGNRANW